MPATSLTATRLPPLVASRWLRLTVFTGAYFAQGVPIGLLTIALPAWLSAHGTTVGEIAAYHSIVGLPWGLKLLSGPFMDRFAFPAMGRRRPWILGAQAGLTLAFVALTLVGDPLSQLHLVIAIGFAINAFGALQDVAVDGMAIDVLPETERGRANAFMAFGQVAGFSSFAAICGFLLTNTGLPTTAAVCAVTVATIFVLVAVVRERSGERLLPWSPGEAAARTTPQRATFAAIFSGLFKVLFLPMSIILTTAEWIVRMRDGVMLSVAPVVATQTLGFTPEAYSYLQGTMGVVMAVVGLAIGPFIDRYGSREFYIAGVGGIGLVTLAFAMSQPLWGSLWWVLLLFALGSFFGQMIFVSFISCAMSLCWLPVAASQFAIYMSLSNLARSIGAGLFAPFANQMNVQDQFLLITALSFTACAVMWMFRIERHRTTLSRLDTPSLATR